ncbi:MAG: bifunctional heptose 7-phosphate kinase/heptose 1-phosphate adenyltransferase, partial [Candidatus Thioglobus sp.]|nr:bifunctional heptose 7-phosphate kinase/heptose 1-phosphate adenyltransferase [Candidatus Thioglobus sp.]
MVGDLMIDHYLWGSSERISPEAPVQIVDIYKENTVLGGAGNVINNLQALGAKVDVISVIGDCKIAAELKDLLGKISVNTGFLVVQKNRLISKKSRLIAAQQQVIRFDSESADEINLQAQNAIKKTFEKIIT